jgi:hypothetical protein
MVPILLEPSQRGYVFLYRRPRKSSEIGDFYFLGHAELSRLSSLVKIEFLHCLIRSILIECYVRREDIEISNGHGN